MKVKELIHELQKCHQNAEVTMIVDYTFEDENGFNPRMPVAGVNEENFTDVQYEGNDFREAILYLGSVRGEYIHSIKLQEDKL